VRIGRRSLFFFAVAAVCVLLIPPTPGQYRWVNIAMACLAAFWAVLLGIESVLHQRGRSGPEPPEEPPPFRRV
jgi:ABC-type transport system involved in cytochrome c biogenesis permease component